MQRRTPSLKSPHQPQHQHKPLRICYIIGSLATGGAEGQLVHLAKGLQGRGHKVMLILFHAKGKKRVEQLRAAGVRVWCMNVPELRPILGLAGKFAALNCLLQCRALLRRWQPDVVHPFFLESELWLTLCRIGNAKGCVVTSRRSLAKTKDNTWWKPWAQNLANRQAQAVVANSEAVARDCLKTERNLPKHFHVIYNGLELSQIPVRTAPPIGPSQQVVCLANYHPYKGHQELIEAWAQIAAEFPHVTLRCCGRDTGMLAQLKQLVCTLGLEERVQLMGPTANPFGELQRSVCLAHPSYEEGLPNAVLEALICNVPIVATTVGGTPELVQGLNHYGMLVQAKNSSALANGLKTVLSAPEAHQPNRSGRFTEWRKSWANNRAVQEYEKLYHTLVNAEHKSE